MKSTAKLIKINRVDNVSTIPMITGISRVLSATTISFHIPFQFLSESFQILEESFTQNKAVVRSKRNGVKGDAAPSVGIF